MQKTQSTATVALAVPKLSQVTQHTQTKAYPQAQLRSWICVCLFREKMI